MFWTCIGVFFFHVEYWRRGQATVEGEGNLRALRKTKMQKCCLSNPDLPSPHHPAVLAVQVDMASIKKNSVPTQRFRAYGSTPLDSLPTRICARTGERYLLWSEIQDAFTGINHLRQSLWGPRVLFMIDEDNEVYVSHSKFIYPAFHKMLF